VEPGIPFLGRSKLWARSVFRRLGRHRVGSSLKIEHERQHAQCAAFRDTEVATPLEIVASRALYEAGVFQPEVKYSGIGAGHEPVARAALAGERPQWPRNDSRRAVRNLSKPVPRSACTSRMLASRDGELPLEGRRAHGLRRSSSKRSLRRRVHRSARDLYASPQKNTVGGTRRVNGAQAALATAASARRRRLRADETAFLTGEWLGQDRQVITLGIAQRAGGHRFLGHGEPRAADVARAGAAAQASASGNRGRSLRLPCA